MTGNHLIISKFEWKKLNKEHLQIFHLY